MGNLIFVTNALNADKSAGSVSARYTVFARPKDFLRDSQEKTTQAVAEFFKNPDAVAEQNKDLQRAYTILKNVYAGKDEKSDDALLTVAIQEVKKYRPLFSVKSLIKGAGVVLAVAAVAFRSPQLTSVPVQSAHFVPQAALPAPQPRLALAPPSFYPFVAPATQEPIMPVLRDVVTPTDTRPQPPAKVWITQGIQESNKDKEKREKKELLKRRQEIAAYWRKEFYVDEISSTLEKTKEFVQRAYEKTANFAIATAQLPGQAVNQVVDTATAVVEGAKQLPAQIAETVKTQFNHAVEKGSSTIQKHHRISAFAMPTAMYATLKGVQSLASIAIRRIRR